MYVPINYFAVVGAAVAAMVVGALWYSPAAFGRQWMALSGKSQAEVEAMKTSGTVWRAYLLTFVAALLTSYVLAHFAFLVGVQSPSDGLQLGVWVWLGFVATTFLGDYLFSGRPLRLYLITAGHHLLALVIMAEILTVWP